ncbi:hypothetical protein ACFL7M_14635 [Thermodesulfobacteriota bacterium]
MKNGKKNLILGVLIGLIVAFFYFHYFAPRYEIKKTGLSMVKIDKWTGKSWRFVDNNWKKVLEIDASWKEVDRTLQEALKVPFVKVDSGAAFKKLRESYPVLNGIPDDELQERIKLVYSKLVLVNMYLGDFLKTSGEETQSQVENK